MRRQKVYASREINISLYRRENRWTLGFKGTILEKGNARYLQILTNSKESNEIYFKNFLNILCIAYWSL